LLVVVQYDTFSVRLIIITGVVERFFLQTSSSSYTPTILKQRLQAQPTLALLLLYPRHVLLADRVPRAHVLLHARLEAALFAAGERCAGLGDAALEAVFVEFLQWFVRMGFLQVEK
jgi:hypothetical protein